MMKRLILLRHAKAAWPDHVEDHARPLAERGRRAAPVMAQWLVANGLRPDLALVSTALRTQETWALAAPVLGKVTKRDAASIYEASAGRLVALIRGVEPSVETLLVIGHNPGMEDLAGHLMTGEGGEAGGRLRQKFPTAAIAVLSLPVEDWTEVGPRGGTLEHFVTPRMLTPP